MPTADNITRAVPWTTEELAGMRWRASSEFDVHAFTCDDCPARHKCELAFDPYNTDGDCLAEK